LPRNEQEWAAKINMGAAMPRELKECKMKEYDITSETPAGTYIRVVVGEKFLIRMPEVRGRIIEPWLGRHTLVDHTCRNEGGGFVEFDMIALNSGCELVEFPLIEVGWDGECDSDPANAEPYAQILVVILQRADEVATKTRSRKAESNLR
jgi:hypothetical protein